MTQTSIEPTRRGRCIDLFAGWGGLSLGFEQGGFDIDLSVDNEPSNVATHEYLFSYGQSLRLDLMDNHETAIRKALSNNYEPDALTIGREIETLIGGPPCTAISAIGAKRPDDPRNKLMGSFIDHGIRLGAKYIVMEQVPTLLQPQNAWLLDDIRERLHRGGYSMVEPQTLRAVDFGVPQRRERVFLLIYRNDCVAPEYPKPTHCEGGDFFLHATPTVADAFDGLPDADHYPELWDRDWAETGLVSPTSRYGRLMMSLENDADDLSYKRVWRRDVMTCSQLTVHEPKSIERFLATQPGGNERISRRHRLDPKGYSLTLRAGSNADHGSFTAVVPIHPKGTRVITAREACRLHGAPDWVRLGPVKITAYRQLGNSVCPPVGAAISRQIMKALDLAPTAPSETVPYGDESLLHVPNNTRLKAA